MPRRLLFAALGLGLGPSTAAAQTPPPAPCPPLPTARQLAWQDLELYAFVHFNMNTFTGREWGEGTEDPDLFQPSALDCDQWARVAKSAGMRGIVLTAKHHDGFCLWPSAVTEHDVASSSWRDGQGDVVRELADACARHGLKLGVYLSPWDRNQPSYGDSPAYNAFFVAQLRELLSGYGPVFEVWFDGACGEGPNGKRQVYDWQAFHDTVRELQPDAVIFHGNLPDVRWCGNENGFVGETNWSPFRGENYVAGAGEKPAELQVGHEDGTHWIPAECDVSIRPGWYYHPEQDDQVKSLAHLEEIHLGSVGRNANLLLNLPVDRRGLVHENDAARLAELGALLRATYDRDLTAGAATLASNVRGDDPRFGPEGVLAPGGERYWATDDDVRRAFVQVSLDEPVVFDRIRIEEPIALGQRIRAFRVEARAERLWSEVARGTTVGARRILRVPPTRADAVRLVVEDARACPLVSRLALYAAPPTVTAVAEETVFLGSTRVQLATAHPTAEIRYTLDGSLPTPASPRYEGVLTLDRSAELVALAFAGGEAGLVPARLSLRAYTPETLREPLHLFRAPPAGLRVAIYEDGWQTLDQLAEREPAARAEVEDFSLDVRPRDEHFALVFEGLVKVPRDGIWAFFLESDDGSRLYVGDELVVENDGLHGLRPVMGEIGLEAGWQPVRVEYFNAGGDRGLDVSWRGPRQARAPIPAGSLGRL